MSAATPLSKDTIVDAAAVAAIVSPKPASAGKAGPSALSVGIEAAKAAGRNLVPVLRAAIAWFDTKLKVAGGAFVVGVLATLILRTCGSTDKQEIEASRSSEGSDRVAPRSETKETEPANQKSSADEPASGTKPAAAAPAEQPASESGTAQKEVTAPAEAAKSRPRTTREPLSKEAAKPAAEAPPEAPPFDKAAASQSLASAAARASRCREGGSGGSGQARVTFALSGKASAVQIVQGHFEPKATACIMQAFMTARAPAFSGRPSLLTKPFTVK
ncbi:MAG TPA: hypothetical protein VL137_16990 [Polyangiaceae bacterium]|nr:hypothetical protein [Polyangiaceae bacterium]